VRLFVRYGLPLAIVVAGIVAMALVVGAAIIGAGLSIFMLNFFFRMSAAGEDDRVAEEEAREYFDRHGHWPDERPRQ